MGLGSATALGNLLPLLRVQKICFSLLLFLLSACLSPPDLAGGSPRLSGGWVPRGWLPERLSLPAASIAGAVGAISMLSVLRCWRAAGG